MEITTVTSVAKIADQSINSTVKTVSLRSNNGESTDKKVDDAKEKKKQEVNPEDALKMTDAMNKFMQLLNADIRFVLHEKTQTLIVQVVDMKEDKVLKEFPAHEFLDLKAEISEYIGMLLDEQA